MKDYDLSILIPSRNEMFLKDTIEDILKNKRGKTEIIAALDGQWASPGIEDHEDVTLIYFPEAIGQRAATNQCARLSNAKYVAKVDAHCTFDEGFDVKLMADMQDDWTVVPTMRNLHMFDWKCYDCGWKKYQGPTPEKCADCSSTNVKRKLLRYAKPSPQSKSYCFDSEPHFQYFREFNKRPEGKGDITPTMSLQGSFFMLTRKKYWELDICDESSFGSWGSQGIEVAAKTWLSGGKVMVNQKTWYAHMFRTQGGDFSFPYPQHQSKVNEAKKKAKDLFFTNSWPLQKYPLSWLVEKFWPVPGWTQQELDDLKKVPLPLKKGIIYYTDNELDKKLADKVRVNLKHIARKKDLSIVSCSLKPVDMGKNIVLNEKRGYLTMFKQILAALEASDADIIFHTEHDILYHPSHFDFTPEKGNFYYNHNWYKVGKDNLAVSWDADQVSGLVAHREDLVKFYRQRVAEFDEGNFDRRFEPMSRQGAKNYKSAYPNIDVRGSWNLTKSKWSLDDFRDKSTAKNFHTTTVDKIPGWEMRQFSDIL